LNSMVEPLAAPLGSDLRPSLAAFRVQDRFMSDMPAHTPFPGTPDIPQPDYDPAGPDMPDMPEVPPEMPADSPFGDDGAPSA